ncbi:MAG: GNAT family N-acetyltransferase [Nocardioidaceae bacterium]|nr:GNAT family N-acetyltransferase [Nocardioidaceae bacterium]
MWVGEIDAFDDELFRAFWDAGRRGDEHGRAFATFWSLQSATGSFRSANNSAEQHAVAVIEDGVVVGANQVMLPLLDNLHVAFVEPLVPPEHRGRGVGTALLDFATRLALDKGRDTLMAEVNIPLDADESAGSRFMRNRGFKPAIGDLHRILDVPLASDRLAELAALAAPYHEAYELVSWDDVVPEEHLDGYCALQAAFNDEAPSGDLDIEAEVWDEARVRNGEERGRLQGRRQARTAALAADGSMVALTEMMTTDATPDRASQGGTLVLAGHRGHRLGVATKVENQRRFQAMFPAVRVVHSWNAEQNGPMVAINDLLGFRPVERLVEMQRKLTGPS